MSLSTHTRRQLGYAEGYLALGMKKQAAEAIGEIEGVDQKASPVLALGLAVRIELEQWAKASVLAATLCKREPEVAGYWVQSAYATRRHKGIAAAREILVLGVGLHPLEAVFHFNLACYEAQLGHLEDARAFLETACGLDPSFVELAKTDEDLAPLWGGPEGSSEGADGSREE